MPTIHGQVRLARRLQAHYQKQKDQFARDQDTLWSHIECRFQQVQEQRLKIAKAYSHGWRLAAAVEQENLRSLLRSLRDQVLAAYEQLSGPSSPVPALADLLSELRHLEDEFDEVVIDREKFLALTTGPIVLKGVDLGRFSLRLHWPRMANKSMGEWIDVVALDPNSAQGNESVTHPHVKDETLCAGDATVPLRMALEQGRLSDAFVLIRSVLETYNPHSAYVSLEDWEGATCWNCNCSVDEDDCSFCESCEHDICSDCMSFCKHCDQNRCRSCQTRCDVCDEACCRRCLTKSACSEVACCKDCIRTCPGCKAKVAPEELDEDAGLCPACLEKQVQNELAQSATDTLPQPLETSHDS